MTHTGKQHRVILAVTLLLGCSTAKVEPITTASGDKQYRIECEYSYENCKTQARAACHGPYRVVGQGDTSCRDCGVTYPTPSPDYVQAPVQSAVFTGVLYVRCVHDE